MTAEAHAAHETLSRSSSTAGATARSRVLTPYLSAHGGFGLVSFDARLELPTPFARALAERCGADVGSDFDRCYIVGNMGTELTSGAVIARRYRLERLLGEGGMGSVWAATHLVTRRQVAMKFIRGPSHLKPDLRRRFLREARAASAVNHPNVVQIQDVFELDDDTPVMVMDLLEGETLASRITRERRLSLTDTIRVMLPVVSAVGTAHSRGIVHRDLKPENVFLARAEDDEEEVIKVLDFGIAKLTLEPSDSDGGVMTGTGTALGTPCYMAPEQCFGERDIDHRADTWALGVMLYELLAGCRPVEGDGIGNIVKQLMTSSITPLEALVPEIPADICALVRRMLARERDQRPQDLREVQETLARHATIKVKKFGPPASLPSSSLDAAQGRASDPGIASSEPDVRTDPFAPTIVGSGSTPSDKAAVEPVSRTFASGSRQPSTTTSAHAIAPERPPTARRWAIAGAVAVALVGAYAFLVRPSATANTSPTSMVAPASPAAAVAAAAPSVAASPVVEPTPQPAAPPTAIPAASATALSTATAHAPSAAKTATSPKQKPASSAAPASTSKPKGAELFDDRK